MVNLYTTQLVSGTVSNWTTLFFCCYHLGLTFHHVVKMLCSDTIAFLLQFLVFYSGSQDCFHVVKLIPYRLDFVMSRALMYSMQYTVKKG